MNDPDEDMGEPEITVTMPHVPISDDRIRALRAAIEQIYPGIPVLVLPDCDEWEKARKDGNP